MRQPLINLVVLLLAMPVYAQLPDLGLGIDEGFDQHQTDPEQAMTITTAWSAEAARPGDTIVLAVVANIDKPFHINPHKTSDEFIPTELKVTQSSPAVIALPAQYPAGQTIEVKYADQPLLVFLGQVVMYVPFRVQADTMPGEQTVDLELHYQMCDDQSCYFAQSRTISASFNVVAAGAEILTPANAANTADLFSGYDEGRSSALEFNLFGWDFEVDTQWAALIWLLALAGGFLLNFTPCVLPLVPIKIMSLSRAAEHGSNPLLLGGVMSLGVLAFWLALGGVIASVSGFSATNQLFQYPVFTLGVGIVIVIMAVGMMGLFAVRLPQWIYRLNPTQDTIHGSFGFGVMTAVLSTPCTAPLMGAAAAWAVTQSIGMTLTTFAAIGLGMALPYAILAAMPKLAERMPRTGPASELIKQVMGLLMLAAATYFVGNGIAGLAVEPPNPPTLAYWWVIAALIAIAGLWLTFRTLQITQSTARRATFGGLGLVMAAAGMWTAVALTDKGPIDWEYYSPSRLERATAQGRVVVLDFTAGWCVNCIALERTYLHRQTVIDTLNAEDVIAMKVDLTGKNEAGNALLSEMGRRSIPYLVVIDRFGQKIFASDAYTDRQVLAAIEEAKGTAVESD